MKHNRHFDLSVILKCQPPCSPTWLYCRQAQCGRWHSLKWSIADLLTSQSSSNVSLLFAWITGPATDPSWAQIWLDPLRCFWGCWVNLIRNITREPLWRAAGYSHAANCVSNQLLHAVLASEVFLASSSLHEVGSQKNYSHVTMKRILNNIFL